MEIRNIETFLKVAELQNFSKAAQQLGYSQSTITVQIKKLESELDVMLFDRIGKRVSLTEQGQRFVGYANSIIKATQTAKKDLNDSETEGGSVRIGMVESMASAIFPDIIKIYHEKFPNVEVVVRTDVTKPLIDMVNHNEVDMSFLIDRRMYNSDWNKLLERPVGVHFICSKKKQFPKKRLTLEDIEKESLILTEKSVSYRYELEQQFAAQGKLITPFLEIGNTDIIRKLVAQDMGISFLPEYSIQESVSSGEIKKFDVDDCKVEIWTQLICHKNKWITPQMQGMIDAINNLKKY